MAASGESERESCGAASGLPSRCLDAGPLLRPANLRGRHPRCQWQQVNCRFCVPTAVAQDLTSTVSPEVTLNTFVITGASAAVGSGRSIFRLNTQLQRGPCGGPVPGDCASRAITAPDTPCAPASQALQGSLCHPPLSMLYTTMALVRHGPGAAACCRGSARTDVTCAGTYKGIHPYTGHEDSPIKVIISNT